MAVRLLGEEVADAPGAFADERPFADETGTFGVWQDPEEVIDGLAFTFAGFMAGCAMFTCFQGVSSLRGPFRSAKQEACVPGSGVSGAYQGRRRDPGAKVVGL